MVRVRVGGTTPETRQKPRKIGQEAVERCGARWVDERRDYRVAADAVVTTLPSRRQRLYQLIM